MGMYPLTVYNQRSKGGQLTVQHTLSENHLRSEIDTTRRVSLYTNGNTLTGPLTAYNQNNIQS